MLMPLPIAAALLIIPPFVTNALKLITGSSFMLIISRLWLMMLLILTATVTASSLLISINPAWSAFGLGGVNRLCYFCAGFTVAYGFSSQREMAVPPYWRHYKFDHWCSGRIRNASRSLSSSLRFSKDELVQALGLSFTLSTVALAAGLYLNDALRIEQFTLSLMSIFPAPLGCR